MSTDRPRYVIFTASRSGSSAMVKTLRSHPEVYCWGNPFWAERQDYPGFKKFPKDVFDVTTYRENPVEFAYALLNYETPHGKPRPVRGMKLWPVHDAPRSIEAVEALGKDDSIRKIVLRRDNELACFSSWWLVRAKRLATEARDKVGADYDGPDPDTIKQIEFNAPMFRQFVKQRFDWYDLRARLVKGPQLHIGYEGVMSTGLNAVAEYIGLDPSHKFQEQTRKRGSGNILDRFVEQDRDAVLAAINELGRPEWIEEHP